MVLHWSCHFRHHAHGDLSSAEDTNDSIPLDSGSCRTSPPVARLLRGIQPHLSGLVRLKPRSRTQHRPLLLGLTLAKPFCKQRQQTYSSGLLTLWCPCSSRCLCNMDTMPLRASSQNQRAEKIAGGRRRHGQPYSDAKSWSLKRIGSDITFAGNRNSEDSNEVFTYYCICTSFWDTPHRIIIFWCKMVGWTFNEWSVRVRPGIFQYRNENGHWEFDPLKAEPIQRLSNNMYEKEEAYKDKKRHTLQDVLKDLTRSCGGLQSRILPEKVRVNLSQPRPLTPLE